MKPLHIGLILPGFSANESDWCIPAILDMVRVLAGTHRIDVYPMRYPHTSQPYQVYGANVFPQNGRTQAGIRRFPLIYRTVRAVMKQHKTEPYDLIHALWVDEPGIVGIILARLLRIPLCTSVMGGEFVNLPEIVYGHQRSLAARLMTRLTVRHADVVTVGSQQLAEQVSNYTKKGIQIIPLGVNTKRFTKLDKPIKQAHTLRLLHVGSLIPVKNQAMLITAFAGLINKGVDAHLDIAGAGPLRDHLEELCEQRGLKDHVTFHGAVEHHHLTELYQNADLCLLTSWHESQSMAALEAGACGVATIGTRVGILPELAPENLLVDPGNADSLCEILFELAQEPGLRQELNQSVHHKVINNFTLQASIEQWNRLYQRT